MNYKDIYSLSFTPIYAPNPLGSQIIFAPSNGFDPIAFCKPEGDVYDQSGYLVRNDRWYNKLDLPKDFKPHELRELKEFMQKKY